MKIVLVIIQIVMFDVCITITMGRISAISTSNTKKIIVIKKNRSEKGNRAGDLGSNPHSKGEHFSRSVNDFFDSIDAAIITIDDSIKMVKAMLSIVIIIYTAVVQAS